ncbi:DNA glycosylase [Fomitiporia mediterranea MF3/22]|uniref:DNA glycosylase n=1 Tax=Fomitiporia mediterranea (strain MF3/22) TaxID=694068 RepID=UPI0004408F38|nr:DNA glycosylase [Fomitiporia mediterranea MF3/22]EJD02473.1 DNA glycosylase [Fomitiporia mediterranea MF3/22]
MSSTRRRTKVISYFCDNSDPGSDFEPKTKRPTKRRKTKKALASADSEDYEHTAAAEANFDIGKAVSHPVSLHSIKHPVAIQRCLLDWYAGVHQNRGMPWRKPFDPTLDAQGRSQRAYEVWISEIMLQQTQVATVIPYYKRWMERFPTITDLAKSDIESVNALWKGLGYYSRAARLLSGAQKIVKEYGGLFPDNAKDMMANVPGIGRYSAGAISSIAYNHCESVLDGNVNRLLSRVLALHANPKSKATLDVLWDGAAAMVKDTEEPGNINQALIELGSTVCKPRDPDCAACPLRDYCNAYRESKGRLPEEDDIEELCTLCEPVLSSEDTGVTRYPMKVERKKAREEVDVVNVVEWLSPLGKRYFLLVRRPDKGLLAGLHEFPSRANVQEADTPEKLRSVGQDVLRDVLSSPPLFKPTSSRPRAPDGSSTKVEQDGLRIVKMKPAGDVLHVFSHIRKTYRVQWILLEGTVTESNLDSGVEKPPALKAHYACSPPNGSVKSEKTRTKKGKAGKDVDDEDEEMEKSKKPAHSPGLKNKDPALRWVENEDVQHANIGTGVMKVWKKVNELWTDSE